MARKFFSFRRYQQTEEVLIVPRPLLELTISLLGEYRRFKVESCCFWYGVETNATESTAITVVIPPQANRYGNFHITGESMKLVSQATRPLKLVNLAQIHTHPGAKVRHSWYDDENVNSRNALSIVLPNYGRLVRPWPYDIGVHEFQDDEWLILTKKQLNDRIRIVSGEAQVIDLR